MPPDTLSQNRSCVKTALPTLLVCVCMGALLAACDDPTNVGGDLLGAAGGDPVNTVEPLSSLRAAELKQSPDSAPRVLAGMVDDPVLGQYEVQGYFDITPVTSDDFQAGSIEAVELRLRRTYVYGDSTSELRAVLREIDEEWGTDDIPAGTSFATGPIITEFTFSAADTLVVVPLPDSWVSDRDPVLRDPDVGNLFHGFRIDPVEGNAVVGFGPMGTTLFATTGSDSLAYPIGKTYPFAERSASVDIPENRFLMQAGIGPLPEFSLSVSSDIYTSGEPFSVNRASLTLWADTLSFRQNTPAHFERSLLRTLDLYARVSGDSTYALIGRSTMDNQGRFVFEGTVLARSIGEYIAEDIEFEIRMPDPATLATALSSDQTSYYYYHSSLNPILFYDADAGDKAPAGFITLTPIF